MKCVRTCKGARRGEECRATEQVTQWACRPHWGCGISPAHTPEAWSHSRGVDRLGAYRGWVAPAGMSLPMPTLCCLRLADPHPCLLPVPDQSSNAAAKHQAGAPLSTVRLRTATRTKACDPSATSSAIPLGRPPLHKKISRATTYLMPRGLLNRPSAMRFSCRPEEDAHTVCSGIMCTSENRGPTTLQVLAGTVHLVGQRQGACAGAGHMAGSVCCKVLILAWQGNYYDEAVLLFF